MNKTLIIHTKVTDLVILIVLSNFKVRGRSLGWIITKTGN